jgi:hypothetical protein
LSPEELEESIEALIVEAKGVVTFEAGKEIEMLSLDHGGDDEGRGDEKEGAWDGQSEDDGKVGDVSLRYDYTNAHWPAGQPPDHLIAAKEG